MKFSYLQSLFALFTLLFGAPAWAQAIASGQFESGAYYHIQVPADWQPEDGLVLWNHGFDLNPPGPLPDLGPLSDVQLSQGYAVAATSYSLNGWALFQTIGDLRDLVHEFERRFGIPEKIYLTGGSMGGLVSVQGLEAAGLGKVVGVYSLCGALGGGRLWDAALDLRLAYDAVCEAVPGAGIDGGAKGLPFRIDPEDYANEDLTTTLAFLLGDRINACTGVLEPPGDRSAAQQARLDQLQSVLGLPNDAFFVTVMGFATAGLSDLVYGPRKLDGRVGTSNVGVDYGDPSLDAEIARVNAAPLPRLKLLNNYRPTGDTGGARVLAIHTDGDGLVPVESLRAYAEVAPEEAYAFAVVDETTPSHCGFTPAEGVAGWQALTAWVEQGTAEPPAADLQTTCRNLIAGGTPGPCRFAPGFEVASLDTVIAPRDVPDYQVDVGVSGVWFNRQRSGEGWILEYLAGNRVLVYWVTYAPEGTAGEQRWLMGVGTADGNTVHATLHEPTGRVFGEALPVSLREWGEISFVFAGPTRGLVRWTGPPAYGSGQSTLSRLAGIRAVETPPIDLGPVPTPLILSLSGSWLDGDWPGEGWQVTILGDTALVYWLTFDSNGQPVWIMGMGETGRDFIQVNQAFVFSGTSFGADFDPGAVEPTLWGRMRFEFETCTSGRMNFNSALPGFGEGQRQLTRFTIPVGSDCAP